MKIYKKYSLLATLAVGIVFNQGCNTTTDHASTSGVPRATKSERLDTAPYVIFRPELIFPEKFKDEKKTGIISMSGKINPDGSVTITEVEETIDEEYRAFFISYFESMKYNAQTVNHEPVTSTVSYRIPISWK